MWLFLSVEMNIGIFDSGFGGLTILREIEKVLPPYNYVYLGDNARAPYGNRSFETVYEYTLQAVEKLFSLDCVLVILACNTASAKALRTIQQVNLPHIDPSRRVLGIIRPSAESVAGFSHSGHIGIMGTSGTIKSESYIIEISKLAPQLSVVQEACPMWVPLVENKEYDSRGADFFVKKHIDSLFERDRAIDTIVLGCTHYPLLIEKIKQFVPSDITIINQGEIVARSLDDYLTRHPEIEARLCKQGLQMFYTTETPSIFDEMASIFMGRELKSSRISLG